MPLKKLALIIGVSVFVFVGAVPASAAPICLKTYMIDSTKTVDSKTIDFRMKDGKVYRNTLRTSCPGLKFNGFVYKTRTGEICGNLQSIRVLRTHEVCMLGAFSELPAAKPESAH